MYDYGLNQEREVTDNVPSPADDIEIKTFPSEDPRLDWVAKHDPKSRMFAIRPKIGTVEEKPRAWTLGAILNQRREGACVGMGWTADLLASPKPDPYTDSEVGSQYGFGVYRRAKEIDEWDGIDYSGTSVLAGAKVIKERGHIEEYRWCFGIRDVRDAVIAEGPVVIGIPWYESMYRTRASGMVEVSGDLVGGHCLLVHGYHPGMRIPGEDYHERFKVFRIRNSWGADWGKNGNGFIRYEDLRDLLVDWGEACAAVSRKMVRLST